MESINTTAKMKREVITVRDLLDRCNDWGIPHFQRGSVWTDDNISMLLESLYYDTPCGNIILWENSDPANGELLVQENTEGKSNGFDCLIIDGQQRTRSLYEALRNKSLRSNSEIEGSECQTQKDITEGNEIPYVWAMNLTKFLESLEKGKHIRYEKMFAKIQDPRSVFNSKIGKGNLPPYPYQYNFLPIYLINKINKDEEFELNDSSEKNKIDKENTIFIKLKDSKNPVTEEVKKKIKEICADFKRIYEREFSLTTITKEVEMSKVIDSFIRINSGGRPVQQEEKAFSRLVNMSRNTTDTIKKIFDKVHQKKGSTRDEYLKRIAERQFGFRLFIRCFILTANYHACIAMGTQALSYSVIQGENLSSDSTDKIWAQTQNVILSIADLLRNELCFDSFSFLPDSRSLYPLMMLLIKYPAFIKEDKIDDKYRKHFAYILLNLLLGCGDSEGKTMALVTSLRESSLDGISMLQLLCDQKVGLPSREESLFKNALDKLDKLNSQWKGIKDIAHNSERILKNKLAQANAVNNRYVLLLYILERSKDAKDFYGDDIPEELIKRLKNQNLIKRYTEDPVTIDVSANPERQHIVPYSVFTSKDDVHKGRISNDPVNNIGNLTYISRDLNHYETGLGALWLNLKKTNDGHILKEPAIRLYNKVKEHRDKKSFNEWIEQRQNDIAEAFAEWSKKLQKNLSLNFDVKIISQADATLLHVDGKFSDNAFLPKLWSIKTIADEDKKKFSWYAFCPGVKLCKSSEYDDWEIRFTSKGYKHDTIKLNVTRK